MLDEASVVLLVMSTPVDEDPGDTVVVPGSVELDELPGVVVVEDVAGGPEVELPPVVPPVSSASTAESQAGRKSRLAALRATKIEEEFWKAMVKPAPNCGGYWLGWPDWSGPVTGSFTFFVFVPGRTAHPTAVARPNPHVCGYEPRQDRSL